MVTEKVDEVLMTMLENDFKMTSINSKLWIVLYLFKSLKSKMVRYFSHFSQNDGAAK